MDALKKQLTEAIKSADAEGNEPVKAILMITLASIMVGREKEMLMELTSFCKNSISDLKNIAAQKN